MSYLRSYEVDNGGVMVKLHIYKCDKCQSNIHESHPHFSENGFHLCWDCSFIEQKISSDEYLNLVGLNSDSFKAAVREGEIIIWSGKPPWEKTNRDLRATKEYSDWRTKVFTRDEYTCQHCGQKGGELNAHHIKPFAKYKDLRYELTNGLTLCKKCHKEVHKRKR